MKLDSWRVERDWARTSTTRLEFSKDPIRREVGIRPSLLHESGCLAGHLLSRNATAAPQRSAAWIHAGVLLHAARSTFLLVRLLSSVNALISTRSANQDAPQSAEAPKMSQAVWAVTRPKIQQPASSRSV